MEDETNTHQVVKRSEVVKEMEGYEKQIKEATEELQRLRQSILVLTGAKLSLGRLIGEQGKDNNVCKTGE
ncbi:FirrV-1-B21 [Feldmannia irregularis virus a]|uniref:FirrV-1-B21 n=1 Tax=Feldmannia irregularis virus a TaxID=231992 RepID=Q6XM15_9PHYC|nr:FirrV-1-B21 [Feldmannia irregularis virus a]AAR26896.1 FirrV-1-B21 [Feldmannia irregularis virus a]